LEERRCYNRDSYCSIGVRVDLLPVRDALTYGDDDRELAIGVRVDLLPVRDIALGEWGEWTAW
jgi:hypothetical protein